MEEIKLDTNKLNNAIDQAAKLPEVPRLEDGKIDIEKIAIGKDNKGYIIPDIIFDSYLKELPEGTTNESQTFRAYNGGKLARLENNIEEASKRGKIGGPASQNTQQTRRTNKEILEEIARRNTPIEELERLGLESGDMLLAANYAAVLKAIRGDVKALEYIRDTLGEKPTEKISAEVETITPEDRKQIERILNRTKTQDIVVED